jgi:hypothetical protein
MRQCSRFTFLFLKFFWGWGDKERGGGADFFGFVFLGERGN